MGVSGDHIYSPSTSISRFCLYCRLAVCCDVLYVVRGVLGGRVDIVRGVLGRRVDIVRGVLGRRVDVVRGVLGGRVVRRRGKDIVNICALHFG